MGALSSTAVGAGVSGADDTALPLWPVSDAGLKMLILDLDAQMFSLRFDQLGQGRSGDPSLRLEDRPRRQHQYE